MHTLWVDYSSIALITLTGIRRYIVEDSSIRHTKTAQSF